VGVAVRRCGSEGLDENYIVRFYGSRLIMKYSSFICVVLLRIVDKPSHCFMHVAIANLSTYKAESHSSTYDRI